MDKGTMMGFYQTCDRRPKLARKIKRTLQGKEKGVSEAKKKGESGKPGERKTALGSGDLPPQKVRYDDDK